MGIKWHKLDSSKADSGAIYGAQYRGNTLLEFASGAVAIVGHMSCHNRESAQHHADIIAAHRFGNEGRDRSISRKVFQSWIVE